jgi:hypothetical protein
MNYQMLINGLFPWFQGNKRTIHILDKFCIVNILLQRFTLFESVLHRVK